MTSLVRDSQLFSEECMHRYVRNMVEFIISNKPIAFCFRMGKNDNRLPETICQECTLSVRRDLGQMLHERHANAPLASCG